MLKKILVGLVISTGVVSSLGAETLKYDMTVLYNNFSSVQRSYFVNDRKQAMRLLADLKMNTDRILGNEKKIIRLLPKGLKDRSKIAITSGRLIRENISKIESVYYDKSLNKIQAEVKAQKALTNIQIQCYKCHNLVRDWNKSWE